MIIKSTILEFGLVALTVSMKVLLTYWQFFFLWQLRVVGINHNSPELQLFSFLQKRLYDLVKYEGLTEPNHDVRIQCESEQEPGL